MTTLIREDHAGKSMLQGRETCFSGQACDASKDSVACLRDLHGTEQVAENN